MSRRECRISALVIDSLPQQTKLEFLGARVRIVVGDITAQQVDAVVNAANSSLLGGGGVDGAIHYKGGPAILEACRDIRRSSYPKGLPAGDAVITTGGNLPARFVIHTVGPVYGHANGREEELLASCYRNSLALAVAHGVGTIAFPSISTGVYNYPRAEAAAVSSAAIEQFLSSDTSLKEVHLVFFSLRDAEVFLSNHKFTS
jgi:O-acetyl-ADP-ribose deacetylase (regulator of RNase III)